MKTIFVLYGIPASGKSTWAREEMRKNPNRYKRVNKDLLRLMIDNDEWSLPNEKFTLSIRDKIVEKSLRHGFDVIVDDTNFPFGGKHFKRMCEIADLVGNVQVVEKYFDVDIKEALKRNNNSDRKSVPEEIIYRMFEKHVKNKHYELQTYYAPPLQSNQDVTLPHCVIFDIDGTLALNQSGRSPYEWHRVGEDSVNDSVVKLNSYVKVAGGDKLAVIIFSGRDAACEDETGKWLIENGIWFDALFMRERNDTRKDNIVKQELYEKYIKNKYYVEFVVDDRDQVVEMWRRLGLTCLQCAPGDF